MSVFRSAVQQITRAVSNKPQGIELAKSVDSKVGDTQKDAANKIKGPTTLEIAAQNKRKGRKSTMLTSATGTSEDYKLSEKTLLG
jgi:hypothetical protein